MKTNASKKSVGRKVIIFTQSIEYLTSTVSILAEKAMFSRKMCLQTNLQTYEVFHPTDKKLYLTSFINLRTQISYHAHQGST